MPHYEEGEGIAEPLLNEEEPSYAEESSTNWRPERIEENQQLNERISNLRNYIDEARLRYEDNHGRNLGGLSNYASSFSTYRPLLIEEDQQQSEAYRERIRAYGQEPVIGKPFKMTEPDGPLEGEYSTARRIDHHKVIIVGEDGVGKSGVLARYMFHSHAGEPYGIAKRQCSSAAYVYRRAIQTEECIRQYHVWDMPRTKEEFLENIREFYDRANAACIVYDVTRPDTYEEAKQWANELKPLVDKIMLVANKTDLMALDGYAEDEAREYASSSGL